MYKIMLLPQAQKDLDKFRGKIFQQIKEKILSLSNNPRPPGCFKLTAEEGYRLRSGNYRIIYRADDKEKIVYLYRIRHRKEAY
ncbi:MAG: type II toxin-antitoxin system RelE/ParE family toxin [Candidatus Aminicenantes bacterium]|nr:type II toxin-antitoxin system RelE/ParE family toxin [Candidatus Aminicenantes bacterium]